MVDFCIFLLLSIVVATITCRFTLTFLLVVTCLLVSLPRMTVLSLSMLAHSVWGSGWWNSGEFGIYMCFVQAMAAALFESVESDVSLALCAMAFDCWG